MAAEILANQPTGAGAGVAGVARNDLWKDQEIQLDDAGVGNTSWEWIILSAPPGSVATLTGEATANASFTPTVYGTYRIRLVTNSTSVQTLVFRVRYSSTGVLAERGWALPAIGEITGENNYAGNTRSWAEVFEFIIADQLNFFNSFGGGFAAKPSCRTVVTTNVTRTGPQVQNGVSLVPDDRVLLVGQTAGEENGSWLVKPGAWVRTPDAAVVADVYAGISYYIQEGTTNAKTTWILDTTGTIVLDTTPLVFSVRGVGQVVAAGGSPLTVTGELTKTLDVSAATALARGTMSSAHFTDLNNASAAATNNAIAKRGPAGEISFTTMTAPIVDSGAATDLALLRNGATRLLIGATAITASVGLIAPSLYAAGALTLGSDVATTSVQVGNSGAPTTIWNATLAGTTTIIDSTTVNIVDRVIHVNHTLGPDAPAPVAICGYSVDRGDVGGVNRDFPGMFWVETDSAFRFALNTAGDDAILGANVPVFAASYRGATNVDLVAASGSSVRFYENTDLLASFYDSAGTGYLDAAARPLSLKSSSYVAIQTGNDLYVDADTQRHRSAAAAAVRTDIMTALGASSVMWAAGVTGVTYGQDQDTAGAGATFTVRAQQGFTDSTGGTLRLGGGFSGTPGGETAAPGDVVVDIGRHWIAASPRSGHFRIVDQALAGGPDRTIFQVNSLGAGATYVTGGVNGLYTTAAGLGYTSTTSVGFDAATILDFRTGTGTVWWAGPGPVVTRTDTLQPSGASKMEYAATVTSVLYGHLTRTTDVACGNTTIASQAPWASSTLTNRNPGNLILAIPSPAAGGAAGKISMTVSGTEAVEVGAGFLGVGSGSRSSAGTIRLPNAGGVYVRNNTDTSDVALVGSDASNIYIGHISYTSGIFLGVQATTGFVGISDGSTNDGIKIYPHSVGAAKFEFHHASTSCSFLQEQHASAAGGSMVVRGQKGFAGFIGGSLTLGGGDGGTPGTNQAGKVIIDLGRQAGTASQYCEWQDNDGGAQRIVLSLRSVTTTTYLVTTNALQIQSGAVSFVAAGNAVFQATAGSVFFDASTNFVNFRGVGSATARVDTINPTGPAGSAWAEAVTSVTYSHATRTTDVATGNTTISSQAPWASATGTNRNPGWLNLTVPSPAAGGTAGRLKMFLGPDTTSFHSDGIGTIEHMSSQILNICVQGNPTAAMQIRHAFTYLMDGGVAAIKLTPSSGGTSAISTETTAQFLALQNAGSDRVVIGLNTAIITCPGGADYVEVYGGGSNRLRSPLTILQASSTAEVARFDQAIAGSAFTMEQTVPWTFNQTIRAGTGANAGLNFTIQAQAGQLQTGATENNNGGNVDIKGGLPGTGGVGDFPQPTGGLVRLYAGTTLVLTSAAGLVTVAGTLTCADLLFPIAEATPTISQEPRLSDVACVDLTITSQAPWASSTLTNRNPGNVVLAVPAPAAGGAAGKVSVKISGSEAISFTTSSMAFASTNAINETASGIQLLSASGFGCYVTSLYSAVYISSAVTSGTPSFELRGNGSTALLTETGVHTGAWTGTYHTSMTSITYTQAARTGASSNGSNLLWKAQNATGTTSAGGFMLLEGGDGTAIGGHTLIKGGNGITDGFGGDVVLIGGNKAGTGLYGNVSINGVVDDWLGGQYCVWIGPAITPPSGGDPSNGGVYLYATSSGALEAIGTSGTVTTVAAADPHCPKCGNDFVFQARNLHSHNHLAICWPCMLTAVEKVGVNVDEFAFVREMGGVPNHG